MSLIWKIHTFSFTWDKPHVTWRKWSASVHQDQSHFSRSGCFQSAVRSPSHPHITVYFNVLPNPWYAFTAFALLHKSANIQYSRRNRAQWAIHLNLGTSQPCNVALPCHSSPCGNYSEVHSSQATTNLQIHPNMKTYLSGLLSPDPCRPPGGLRQGPGPLHFVTALLRPPLLHQELSASKKTTQMADSRCTLASTRLIPLLFTPFWESTEIH